MKTNKHSRLPVDNDNLTKKQKAYADYRLQNPTHSDTKAVLATYDTDNPKTASVIAHTNNQLTPIKTYLMKHSQRIEDTLTNNFYRLATSEILDETKEGNRVGMWMHDKIHGKATQKIEQQSTSVNINIDLTQETEE